MTLCPLCGSKAYVGLTKVECENVDCKLFPGSFREVKISPEMSQLIGQKAKSPRRYGRITATLIVPDYGYIETPNGEIVVIPGDVVGYDDYGRLILNGRVFSA